MENNDKKKIIISIIAVLLIVVLIAGGTFAWWTWTSTSNTAVTFTVQGGSMTIDGGGNITAQKLVPTDQCNHSTYAIHKKVTVTATNQTATSMTATVQLDLSDVPTALRTSNLKYTFSTTDSCTTGSPTGTLAGTTTPFTLTTFNVAANSSETKEYYLYIWLDSAETSSATQGKSFSITYTGTLVQNAS